MEITSIVQSISFPQLIKDDFIRKGTFLRQNGQLVRYSGGFTVVFPCEVNGDKWAFRCWHNDLGNMASRFQKLSEAMTKHPFPYFCDFKYVDEGIVVDGKIYPTSRMKWIDGNTIKDYICKHKYDRQKLEVLADSFLTMCKEMHKVKFSHGDLQHGNIIVDNQNKLFLIDYDSLYHPSMGDMSDIIVGLPNYQHPKRSTNKKATEKADYFSELIIYSSILAIAQKPDLADKYNVENADALLFRKDDYTDFENSDIYNDLCSLGEPFVSFAKIIQDYLSEDNILSLEPMEVMFDRYFGEPEILKFEADRTKVYKGDKVTFSWIVEHVSKVYLNNKEIPLTESSAVLTVNEDTPFCLKIANALGKEVSKIIDIKTVDRPIISLNSDVKYVKKGGNDKVKIDWKTEHTKSVSLSDNQGDVLSDDVCGTIVVEPKEDCVYTLNVVGLLDDNYTESVEVKTIEDSEIKFKSSLAYIYPEIPVKLEWDVKNADRITLNGEDVGNIGQKVVELENTETYTLTVENKLGTKEEKLKVTVLPIPVINLNINPPNINCGVSLTTPTVDLNKDGLFNPLITLSAMVAKAELPQLNLNIPFVKDNPQFVQDYSKNFVKLIYKDKTLWQKTKQMMSIYCQKMRNGLSRTMNKINK